MPNTCVLVAPWTSRVVWQRSGGELYYRGNDKMMAVSITTSPALHVSAPRELWTGSYSEGSGSSCDMPGVSSSNYDVSADGRRFLMVRDDDSSVAGTRVVVVLNWAEELRQLAPPRASTTARASAGN